LSIFTPIGVLLAENWPPFLKRFQKKWGSQVLFAKVNIDKAKKTAEHSKIESIPTLIVYKNGKEVKRHVGGCNAETLRRFVQSAL
jgi:thioredoxin-like negative regulator of GroEL